MSNVQRHRRNNDGNNFGARMRVRRKARGWGIREAAGAAGISPSTWSRGERGHLTSITILKKIADVLDGHLSEMLREDEAYWEDYAQDRLKARFYMEGIRGAPEGMMP